MGLWQIIEWLILGGVAGFIASKIINKTGEGLVMDIVLGIVGAVVGGFIAAEVFHKGDVSGVNVESIVISVLGAILVLFVYRAVSKRQTA